MSTPFFSCQSSLCSAEVSPILVSCPCSSRKSEKCPIFANWLGNRPFWFGLPEQLLINLAFHISVLGCLDLLFHAGRALRLEQQSRWTLFASWSSLSLALATLPLTFFASLYLCDHFGFFGKSGLCEVFAATSEASTCTVAAAPQHPCECHFLCF